MTRYLEPAAFAKAKEANLNDHTRCRVNHQGDCWGYHCIHCGASCSMMGHGDGTHCHIQPLDAPTLGLPGR